VGLRWSQRATEYATGGDMSCEICKREHNRRDVLCQPCRESINRLATICSSHPDVLAQQETPGEPVGGKAWWARAGGGNH
jgi:hypothetical protein